MQTIAFRLLFATLLLLGFSRLFAFSKKEAKAAYSQIDDAEYPVKGGDCLFFRFQWKAAQDAAQEEMEGQQLEAQFEAIETYVCKGLQELRIKQSPFGEKLSRIILPPLNFKLPEIEMVTVKEEEKNGEHSCVFACEASAIEKVKTQLQEEAVQLKNYSEQQWAKLLKTAFDALERKEDKRSFLTLLGCPIVTFIRERDIRYVGMDFNETSKAAWQEIGELLSWPAGADSYFLSRKDSFVWRWVWATRGNVDFSNAPQKDNGEFEEGKTLYHQGKDIPRIMELFGRSIEFAPNSQEKWRYLGGILRVNKQYKDSLVAYLQAAKFGTLPKEDLKTILSLCEACGLTTNAKGLKWYQLMNFGETNGK